MSLLLKMNLKKFKRFYKIFLPSNVVNTFIQALYNIGNALFAKCEFDKCGITSFPTRNLIKTKPSIIFSISN